MKRTYETGIDNNSISCAVRVGTVGVAYTSADIIRSGGQTTRVAESNEQSGSISERTIGSASYLRDSYLVVRTIIDLSHVDKSLWAGQKDNLVIRYALNGGFSGSQVYNQDLDDINTSPDGKIIIVTKPIELK